MNFCTIFLILCIHSNLAAAGFKYKRHNVRFGSNPPYENVNLRLNVVWWNLINPLQIKIIKLAKEGHPDLDKMKTELEAFITADENHKKRFVRLFDYELRTYLYVYVSKTAKITLTTEKKHGNDEVHLEFPYFKYLDSKPPTPHPKEATKIPTQPQPAKPKVASSTTAQKPPAKYFLALTTSEIVWIATVNGKRVSVEYKDENKQNHSDALYNEFKKTVVTNLKDNELQAIKNFTFIVIQGPVADSKVNLPPSETEWEQITQLKLIKDEQNTIEVAYGEFLEEVEEVIGDSDVFESPPPGCATEPCGGVQKTFVTLQLAMPPSSSSSAPPTRPPVYGILQSQPGSGVETSVVVIIKKAYPEYWCFYNVLSLAEILNGLPGKYGELVVFPTFSTTKEDSKTYTVKDFKRVGDQIVMDCLLNLVH